MRLRPYFDPPNPEDSEAWWNGGFGEVRVVDGSGAVVHRVDLAELHGARRPGSDDEWLCGKVREQSGIRFFESHFCPQEFPVELDMAGAHTVEVEVWVHADRDVGERRRLLSMDVGVYLTGDTWYRDMRAPGFDDAMVPDADDSLPWLGRRIVEDGRFAEATVKFWWPSIMGAEVAEAPENAGDADFGGRLLGANAEAVEVARLARGFRRGFRGRKPYNLKDLLVETALSKWFRGRLLQGRRSGPGGRVAPRRRPAAADARGVGAQDRRDHGLPVGAVPTAFRVPRRPAEERSDPRLPTTVRRHRFGRDCRPTAGDDIANGGRCETPRDGVQLPDSDAGVFPGARGGATAVPGLRLVDDTRSRVPRDLRDRSRLAKPATNRLPDREGQGGAGRRQVELRELLLGGRRRRQQHVLGPFDSARRRRKGDCRRRPRRSDAGRLPGAPRGPFRALVRLVDHCARGHFRRRGPRVRGRGLCRPGGAPSCPGWRSRWSRTPKPRPEHVRSGASWPLCTRRCSAWRSRPIRRTWMPHTGCSSTSGSAR